ncbi:spore germination lipoprotein GerD [Paenibacillus sp. 3LSP]|uniref:spore germination lipoprotein GerD n=1 Tax=Paenibacillus sp. 3LSP TaxID=2800795 RepID=UPI0028FD8C7D|nr:spore germination lipoprotein GerD [Paenibacillus sp. 3LSP]MDU0332903.1 spore germination lipoprotein GerD [Paenibacillus sp. 3LSP]
MKWRGTRWILCFLCTFTLPLAACGSEQSSSSSSQGGGYKETKSMVIDILKTDEGKKAIYEALSSPPSSESGGSESGSESGSDSGSGSGGSGGSGSFGVKMILPSQTANEVRMAVKETITSPEYKKEIEKIMTDPQFAGDFAKAINAQSKELHMQLIKDPTYQKAISDILKSPEVMKMFLDLTKTPDYRKQSMTVMQEAMQSPLFKMEVLELLKTVVQEQLQPKVEKEPKDDGGKGGDDGGDEGGQSKEGGGSGGAS